MVNLVPDDALDREEERLAEEFGDLALGTDDGEVSDGDSEASDVEVGDEQLADDIGASADVADLQVATHYRGP